MRSINTSLIGLLPVAGLLFVGAGILGVGTLKDLALVLFVGLATGAYSSMFLATPWLVDLKLTDQRYKLHTQRVLARRAGGEVKSEPKRAKVAAKSGAGGPSKSDEDSDDDEPTRSGRGAMAASAPTPGARPARPG